MSPRFLLRTALFPLLLAAAASAAAAAGPDDPDRLKAFPPAKAGMTRFVIDLPTDRGEPGDLRVQLIVGKTILTDGVNNYSVGGGRLERKTVEGWGYDYHEVSAFGPTSSTRMAPPPGAPSVERFIQTSDAMLPYDGRLPLVVYAPADAEVRYRVWKAAGDAKPAAPR